MIDEEQVKNIVKKILDKEHLTDFIKIFEKEHNLFRGSHDKITLPENIVISEKIITQVIQAGLLKELGDVEISSPMGGDSLIYDASDKKWKNGKTEFMFIDNFADDSQFWAWQLFMGDTPAGKSGLEANGGYTLSIDSTKNGRWEASTNNQAPRLFIGILSYPCEIITKLDSFTRNENTQAGLFLAKSAIQFGTVNQFAIVQRYKDPVNGVCVVRDSELVKASTDIQTLPMWLRIRIGCPTTTSVTAYFDYSVDGKNWVNLYSLPDANFHFGWAPPCVGIFVSNSLPTPYNAVEAKFDFFQMTPKSMN